MTKNIIIGKTSKLTLSLKSKIGSAKIISSNKINYEMLKSDKSEKVNYIFNNFYPSYKLNQLKPNEYKKFVELSLVKLTEILSNLKTKNINKIIYTSSASVYSLSEQLDEFKLDKNNRKIYASFKYSAEKIVENFCRIKKINFYIMRLFNTYGDESDKFSFIEKLIKVKKKGQSLTLYNNGISLRDFIHLKDVGLIYKKFLNNKYESGIYDIGTGYGILIKNLIEFIGINKKKIINQNNINEITRSIANVDKLNKNLRNFKFSSLENYLRNKITVKNNRKLLLTKNNYSSLKYEGSVIYGAGFAGKELFERLKQQKERVIFFVDDDPKKHNTLVNNIPVISFDNLRQINKRKIVDKVFIAIPSLDKFEIINLNKKLSNYFFDVRYLPEKKFLVNNYINLNDLKNDQLNSFLNRKPINIKRIKGLKGKNILVTGATGTIGFEICRQLIFQEAKNIIGIDKSEIGIYEKKNQINKKVKLLLCDVNDNILLDQIISKNNIHLIVHAAAYKHVNILEQNVHAAVLNNIVGTKKVCEVAIKNNANLILISTDKAADPKSILGYSKRVCEQIVHYYNLNNNKRSYFNIVRFGNVFGSSGSAVTKFIEQINNNEPLTVTNKLATRFFMTILEACYLVLETTSLKIKNKTFILNMGKQINIYKLAKKLSEYKKGLNPNYEVKFIITGLKKNEKLHEKLFEKKELLHKINRNIFYVGNNQFQHKKFYNLLSELENNYRFYSPKKITNCLKLICKI